MPNIINLHRWNAEAYDKLTLALNHTNRACIIHPTGTGKGIIGMHYAQRHKHDLVLWMGPTPGIFDAQMKKAYELSDGWDFSNVEYMSYPFAATHLDDKELDYVNADTIILDEFHHVGAAQWGQATQRILDNNPDAKIIGLSATAIRYSDGGRNMAEELFDGNVASQLLLEDCWANHILNMPNYIIAAYDVDHVLHRIHEEIDKEPSPAAKQRALKEWRKYRDTVQAVPGPEVIIPKSLPTNSPKMICFCRTKTHVEDVVRRIPEWFASISSEQHVYATYCDKPDGTKEYEEFLADDSDCPRILVCINQLNEGIHIDDIDGVIFCRRTQSPTVFYQQLGRALDTCSNKERVVFDLVDNYGCLKEFNIYKRLESAIKRAQANNIKLPFDPDTAQIDPWGLLEKIEDYSKDIRDLEQRVHRALKNKGFTTDEMVDAITDYYDKIKPND